MKRIKMDMFRAIMRLLVGLMLIGFGVFWLVDNAAQNKRCSEEVTGTVIRLDEQQRRSRTYSRPVFEYEFGGQKYTFAGYFDRNNHYHVGQTTRLRINPNDPSDAYEADKSRWFIYPILIAGAGMLLFGIYTVKVARADKQSEMY